MQETTVIVQERAATGKNANRRLRTAGRIPAVVYGAGKPPVPISVDERTMHELLKAGNDNAIFLLQLGDSGKSRHAMIRELRIDPIERKIEHIDFQRVLLTEKVRVRVHIVLGGTPEGVKNEGGVLDFQTRELELECLPKDIPAHLSVEVSGLRIGQHIEAREVALPARVTLMSDGHQVVASVAHSRVEVEAAPSVEGLVEAVPTEPEVIGRGKKEESEEGEA
ncbi:MAG: 50S ribosomal protein L25 [Thermoanaerobaculia bacterium]